MRRHSPTANLVNRYQRHAKNSTIMKKMAHSRDDQRQQQKKKEETVFTYLAVWSEFIVVVLNFDSYHLAMMRN